MTDLGFPAVVEEMYTESARLKSFKNWPFEDDSKCSAAKMAEAGFFHCPTTEEPDVVQCYVCFKELDGWEQDDNPWEEHFTHSKICLFAKIRKAQKDLTVSEVYEIEAERKINKTKKLVAVHLQNFKNKCEDLDIFISELSEDLGKKKK